MTVFKDVFAELFAMFMGDAWLAAAVLIVVAATAALIDVGDVPPLLSGGVLLVGCLAVLVGAVLRVARHQKAVTDSRKA